VHALTTSSAAKGTLGGLQELQSHSLTVTSTQPSSFPSRDLLLIKTADNTKVTSTAYTFLSTSQSSDVAHLCKTRPPCDRTQHEKNKSAGCTLPKHCTAIVATWELRTQTLSEHKGHQSPSELLELTSFSENRVVEVSNASPSVKRVYAIKVCNACFLVHYKLAEVQLLPIVGKSGIKQP